MSCFIGSDFSYFNTQLINMKLFKPMYDTMKMLHVYKCISSSRKCNYMTINIVSTSIKCELSKKIVGIN